MGKVVINNENYKILNLITDIKDLSELKQTIKTEFGQPTSTEFDHKGFTYKWNDIDILQYHNSTLYIFFNKHYRIKNNREEYYSTTITFVITDKNGKDLLTSKNNHDQIKSYLENKINSWDI